MHKRVLQRICVIIALFFIGMALARANIYKGISPFGMAVLMALVGEGGFFGVLFTGLCAGAVSTGLTTDMLAFKLVPYLLAGTLSFIFLKKNKKSLLRRRIISVAAYVLPAFIVPISLYSLLQGIINAACVLVVIPVCIKAVSILKKDRTTLSRDESFSLLLLLCVVLIGVSGIEFFGFSLMGVLVAAAVIFASITLGAPAATSIGALMGFLTLSAGMGADYAMAICTAAVLAGVFGEISRPWAIGGYLLGNILVSLIINERFVLELSLWESVIGSSVLLLPSSVFKAVSSAGVSISGDRSGRTARMITYKLSRMAGVFSGLADAYDEACAAISPVAAEKLGCEAEISICQGCNRYRYCWDVRRKDTIDDLRKLALATVKGERIENAIPQRCIETIKLVGFMKNKVNASVKREIDPHARIMAGYCRNLERIVKDMADAAKKETEYDSELERAIINELDQAGIAVRDVMAVKSSDNTRITIIKRPCNGTRDCERKIQQRLSRCCNTNIRCLNSGCDAGAYCISEYEEAVRFSVSTGIARRCKEGCGVSGDSFAFAHLPDGRYMLALSDGMGSGDKAREESDTTISFIESFLASGMDEYTMLDVVNQLLILRGREDTYSTVDICILELIKGISVFLKIGACAGFIKRGNNIEVVEAGSLPIGIIEGVVPAVSTRMVKDGDIIILISDGILDAYTMDVERFKQSLQVDTLNPQEFADFVLDNAIKAAGNCIRDDMTVIAVKIWEGRIG
ncbi:MAG TPA: SpoIIE family protein phosphatase [Clostridia bacterium]|nr:SpoIIE family protein phosphatase [Clostridia bacterium]